MKSDPLSTTIVGCLTNRIDGRFSQMVASLPDSISTIILVDALEEKLTEAEWKRLCAPKNIVLIPHSAQIESFAALRNEMLKAAQELDYKWMLFLDSDEIWKSSEVELRQAIKNAEKQGSNAISCLRSDVFYGRELQHGEAGRQPLPRILSTSSVTYRGATHEAISDSTFVLSTELQILHYSHESISQFIDVVSQYARRIGQNNTTNDTSTLRTLVELALFPWAKWVYNVVFRLGFLDGWQGIVYASCMSLHSLLVRVYRYERFHTSPHR